MHIFFVSSLHHSKGMENTGVLFYAQTLTTIYIVIKGNYYLIFIFEILEMFNKCLINSHPIT